MNKETEKAMKAQTAKALASIAPEFDAIAHKLDSIWHRINSEYGFKTNKDKDAVMGALSDAEKAVITARKNLSAPSPTVDVCEHDWEPCASPILDKAWRCTKCGKRGIKPNATSNRDTDAETP